MVKLWKSILRKSSIDTELVLTRNSDVRVCIPSWLYWYLKNVNKGKLMYVFRELWYKIYYKQFCVVKQFIM